MVIGWRKKVTYTFQTPYTYQEGDVWSLMCPIRIVLVHLRVIFILRVFQLQSLLVCACREERYAFYASMPSIAFTVEPPSSDPILYVRYNQRTYNYGYIAGSASYDLPITNLGKNDLHITKSESSIFLQ